MKWIYIHAERGHLVEICVDEYGTEHTFIDGEEIT